MHMSEAGSLMASLLPMTTDVQTTMMRAEGAASPTSVASHCASSIAEPSLPTSPVAGAASAAHKKPRFSLTVESVGPAAPEEDGRRASKRARSVRAVSMSLATVAVLRPDAAMLTREFPLFFLSVFCSWLAAERRLRKCVLPPLPRQRRAQLAVRRPLPSQPLSTSAPCANSR